MMNDAHLLSHPLSDSLSHLVRQKPSKGYWGLSLCVSLSVRVCKFGNFDCKSECAYECECTCEYDANVKCECRCERKFQCERRYNVNLNVNVNVHVI